METSAYLLRASNLSNFWNPLANGCEIWNAIPLCFEVKFENFLKNGPMPSLGARKGVWCHQRGENLWLTLEASFLEQFWNPLAQRYEIWRNPSLVSRKFSNFCQNALMPSLGTSFEALRSAKGWATAPRSKRCKIWNFQAQSCMNFDSTPNPCFCFCIWPCWNFVILRHKHARRQKFLFDDIKGVHSCA